MGNDMQLIRVVALSLLCALGLTGKYGTAIGAPTDDARQVELSAIDFEGRWLPTCDASFPKDAFRAFSREANMDVAEEPFYFAWVNLDRDGENELVIASRKLSGSGGTGYFILRKVGKVWQRIAEFQGGLVFSLDENPSPFYRITSYPRSGETWQVTYEYRGVAYQLTSHVLLPKVISRSTWWHPFWLRINSYGSRSSRRHYCDDPPAGSKDKSCPSGKAA
ncbi:MAG: hypothetical protein JW384_01638 [Nitrosomonadaceae bacterium]|nr:hypothetical protein [Nitrosomonadaceae bacterium]